MRVATFAILSGIFLVNGGAYAAPEKSLADQIGDIAANSKCRRVAQAPAAFMRGFSLVFAKAICQPQRADVTIVSSPAGSLDPHPERTDALTWYDERFAALGMSNNKAGVDTLRHSYALMVGLAMNESSGRYCVGRDLTANFDSADTAEAGVFQTSWGAHKVSDVLKALNEQYAAANGKGCLLDIFSKGVKCGKGDAKNWGDPNDPKDKDGLAWQQLTKSCPAFATEYAAVLVRKSGGRLGEFGPLRRHQAKLHAECDTMLSEIQTFVSAHNDVCGSFR